MKWTDCNSERVLFGFPAWLILLTLILLDAKGWLDLKDWRTAIGVWVGAILTFYYRKARIES